MRTSAAKRSPEPPHRVVHVELLDWLTGPAAPWPEWRRLYGGGLRSWLRWVWRMGTITHAEAHLLYHEKLARERKCHEYEWLLYCYCDETFESREWTRHYREALEEL